MSEKRTKTPADTFMQDMEITALRESWEGFFRGIVGVLQEDLSFLLATLEELDGDERRQMLDRLTALTAALPAGVQRGLARTFMHFALEVLSPHEIHALAMKYNAMHGEPESEVPQRFHG